MYDINSRTKNIVVNMAQDSDESSGSIESDESEILTKRFLWCKEDSYGYTKGEPYIYIYLLLKLIVWQETLGNRKRTTTRGNQPSGLSQWHMSQMEKKEK